MDLAMRRPPIGEATSFNMASNILRQADVVIEKLL